jgi:hypothetical protein
MPVAKYVPTMPSKSSDLRNDINTNPVGFLAFFAETPHGTSNRQNVSRATIVGCDPVGIIA